MKGHCVFHSSDTYSKVAFFFPFTDLATSLLVESLFYNGMMINDVKVQTLLQLQCSSISSDALDISGVSACTPPLHTTSLAAAQHKSKKHYHRTISITF